MSKITQLNLDGALLEVKDPRFENDKFFQYNLGTISETPDTSQNETLQKIYNAAASGGSVMAIYDGILLDVSEVSADKMVLSSSSGLTFLKINATVTAGAVTEAVRISTTPIIYGETDYEDGVTPLPTGTIYCYWENNTSVDGMKFSSPNPFTIKMYKAVATSASSETGYINRQTLGHNGDVTSLEYSTDNGNTWNDFTATHTAEAAQNSTNGYSIILRGNGGTGLGKEGSTASPELGTCSNIEFVGSDITVSGSLIDLVDYENKSAQISHHAFQGLFADNANIIEAKDVKFADIINTESRAGCSAYSYIFANCTSLVHAPETPIVINTIDSLNKEAMPKWCFLAAFKNCTNLTTSIKIEGQNQTLDGKSSDQSYYMGYAFYKCSSLTECASFDKFTFAGEEAPMYSFYMAYYQCTSLTEAVIPAYPNWGAGHTNCGHQTFEGCTNLSKINLTSMKIGYTDFPCCNYMFKNTKMHFVPSGTPNAIQLKLEIREAYDTCYGMFEGCTFDSGSGMSATPSSGTYWYLP